MADNVTLNSASGGDTVAADDIGGVKHQRVKIQHGADGSATDVSTASPLPVSDAGGSLTVDSAQLPAALVGGRLDVVLGAALPAGSANIGDVDIASIAAGDNNIGNVDVVTLPALPAGTNNIGDVDVLTLPALPAGTNNIGDVDVLSVVPGTTSTALGKPEDGISGSGFTGVAVLAVRRDTAASGVDADGDFATINVNSAGRLYTSATLDAAIPAGTNNIGDVDVLTLPGVTGAAAHDAVATGNPVLVGGYASAARPAAVANGDAAQSWTDLHGSPIVLLGGPNALTTRGLTNFTTTTAADVIAAAGAGVKIAVMGIMVTNAHASVATKVSIRDDATVKVTGYAPAAGGGFVIASATPIFTTAANAPVRAVCGTTGADVDVNVWGYLTV